MSFRDNLQHLRATHSMTQEQLAMLLGVSRQSVTKWEAERAYPEMDKLLKLCQIFDCTLDDLVTGDLTARTPSPVAEAQAAALREAAGGPPQDVCGYDEHMGAFAWKIAGGVGAILLGVTLMLGVAALCTWLGLGDDGDALGLIPLLLGVGAGVGLIVTASFQHAEFQRSHPYIQDFYTTDDRRRTQRLFTTNLVVGLCLIFAGVVACTVADGRGDLAEEAAATVMLGCVAVAALLIVFASVMLGRLNVANYNRAREQALADGELYQDVTRMDTLTLRRLYTDEQICSMLGVAEASDVEIARARARLERAHRKSQISGGLCGIIMIVATIAGLTMLFVPGYQSGYFWLAWVFGGLLCGVASITVSVIFRDEPSL